MTPPHPLFFSSPSSSPSSPSSPSNLLFLLSPALEFPSSPSSPPNLSFHLSPTLEGTWVDNLQCSCHTVAEDNLAYVAKGTRQLQRQAHHIILQHNKNG